MNKEILNQYLDNLPFTKVIKERINTIVEINEKIYEKEILDIFVCDYKNTDSSKNYSSLWLFYESAFLECKNFINQFDFDYTPIKNKFEYCSIELEEFDLENISENSKINFNIQFSQYVTGNFTATGENCIYAYNIYKKYVVANLE